MAKNKVTTGFPSMKLIAIKEECYAISGVDNTRKLKKKYQTLCKGLDFRRRKTWETILNNLRTNGDWSGITLSDLDRLAVVENLNNQINRDLLVFHPGRIDMDRDAENDD